MKLKLYSRYRNSAGQRVRIALNLKGLTYEYVPIGDVDPDQYRTLNPQNLIPTLVMDGTVLTQSTAIVELLEELVPSPALLPADPIVRAQARSFAQAIACEIHPVNNHRVRDYLETEHGWSNDATMTWYRHWLAVGFTDLEAMLEKRAIPTPYCFSDDPGFADLYLVPQVFNARLFGLDMSRYPLADAIDRLCAKHPAFEAAAPENQPDCPEELPTDGR